jgi:uncharacterized membrane protein YjgN (DUF898 family)
LALALNKRAHVVLKPSGNIKRVFISGISNGYTIELNKTYSKVNRMYGMANFSIGLANDSSRKYVFIKGLYKNANLTVIS